MWSSDPGSNWNLEVLAFEEGGKTLKSPHRELYKTTCPHLLCELLNTTPLLAVPRRAAHVN